MTDKEIIKWKIDRQSDGKINLYCFVNEGTAHEKIYVVGDIKEDEIDEAKQNILKKAEIDIEEKENQKN